jgi:hypothetical protein
MKAEQRVNKVTKPPDEQRNHQPMNIDDEIVHLLAVFGSEDRHAEKFFGAMPQRVKKISHSQSF